MHTYIYIYTVVCNYTEVPKMGVPPNHPWFYRMFHRKIINHPFRGETSIYTAFLRQSHVNLLKATSFFQGSR